jgi:PIN domain nuclease of toxin-antitoxin system
MRALADTHAAIWYLWKPGNLSRDAIAAMDQSARLGERVGLSTVTLCEIIYLVEKQRIRNDAFDLFLEAIQAPDGLFEEVPLDSGVASMMRTVPRAMVPEMPDRIIAASALSRKVPLITRDTAIRNSSIPTIW